MSKTSIETMLLEIAHCFAPNINQALNLILDHLVTETGEPLIICDDGANFTLDEFHNLHLKAFEKRLQSGVPNLLSCLETELCYISHPLVHIFAQSKKLPPLDHFDNGTEMPARFRSRDWKPKKRRACQI